MRAQQPIHKQTIYLLTKKNMRKTLLLLGFILALASCSADYTIEGSIDGAIDGDSVILGYSVNGINFTETDRTVIEQGKFKFAGKTNGSKIYYIGYEHTPEPTYVLFFLEGGDIKAEIHPGSYKVTGTPANNLNYDVEVQLAEYLGRMNELERQIMTDTLMADSTKSVMVLTAMETQRDAILYIKDVIRNNITSIVGMFLLVQYDYYFDNEEFNMLVDRIPDSNIDRNNNCLYDILREKVQDRSVSHDIDIDGDDLKYDTTYTADMAITEE